MHQYVGQNVPVFRQVKMARISYKPIQSTSLLPYQKYSGFDFSLPPSSSSSSQITKSQPVFGIDTNPLDVTSMKRALADISELPTNAATLSSLTSLSSTATNTSILRGEPAIG